MIIDYSWNHTGNTFWAWKDLVKNQAESRFHDWYDIVSFDDPETPENEFQFKGWLGVKTLPELKKVNVSGKRERDGHVFEGDLHPEVKAHIFNITKRWLDPDGDGDPSEGVDGFRLDVATHVPLGFWRDYRKFVRGINPDALLLGEAWWTKWPDELMDPRPFLQGDIFDSVMHYQWYKPARRLFAHAEGGLKPTGFIAEINRVYAGYSPAQTQNLMNLVASHDSPRFGTSFQNKHKYKYRMGARGNKELKLGPPSAEVVGEMRMMLLHQFTFTSAPHIWSGDELGMWGADDPDCRKPILWDDVEHLPQVFTPDGQRHEPIPVKPDTEMFNFQRKLIALRKKRPDWSRGQLNYILANDNAMTLAYRRKLDDQETFVAFNLSGQLQTIRLTTGNRTKKEILVESSLGGVAGFQQEKRTTNLTLSPYSGVALGVE